MSDLLGAGRVTASVEALALEIDIVGADLKVSALDEMFRTDPALMCVAVRPPCTVRDLDHVDVQNRDHVGVQDDPAAAAATASAVPARGWGLLTRERFHQLMTGPLGYGRLLLARHNVQALADWSPLVVQAGTDIAQVARLVVEHQGNGTAASREVAGAGHLQRHEGAISELLVVQAGRELRRLPVATVFQALSGQLAARALTDPLTQLPNRDHFLQYLHRHCAQPEPGERLGVVYIDLDGFKAFNDSYGHGIGDRVLQVVAERLRGSCRPQDLPARLGGDEFAIVVRFPADVEAEQAAAGLGQRVLACLGGTITVGQLVLPGRASVGVAIAADLTGKDAGGLSGEHAVGLSGEHAAGHRVAPEAEAAYARADLLLREADLAMYQAKVAGGHRVQVVTGVGQRARAHTPVMDRRELHRAMAAQEFVLHYQPITEVSSGQLASVEALVRWQHPTRGLLAPGAFLDAVADAGFAAELDRFVLHSALGQLRAWTETLGAHAPASMNVNLSIQGLQTPGLADMVLTAIGQAQVAPKRLRLEVPESATVEHLQAAATDLARLRGAGVRLTLDDLGAGASTLHHLTDLSLDGMKIDRRFVAGMLEDDRDAAVVRMLLELGLSTGLTVTAEGVETEQQLALLQDMAHGRAVYVQGYLRGRPVPVPALQLPWPKGTLSVTPSHHGRAEEVTPS